MAHHRFGGTVIEERQIAALIEQSDRSRRAHDWNGAINLLKRALSLDPEHARAHACLSLALLGARRLHGASLEVELALAFDGNDPFCHYAAAAVRRGQRKLDQAWQHVLVALHDDHADADTHVLAASIKVLENDRAAAHTLLSEALALDANHVDALTELASLELRSGDVDAAKRRIELALTIDPANGDAHIVAGYIALRTNDVSEAESHARFALHQDAGDRDALGLWTAIKARRNILLGIWWRFNALISLRSERAFVGILLGSFVVVRIAILVLGALGFEDIEDALSQGWLLFCAYTWIAPRVFDWMLQRELKTVMLRDDY